MKMIEVISGETLAVLYLGECLKVMDGMVSQGIRVDAIITDPPYGTTACKWDSVIPFERMWERVKKLIKPNGAIVLFGSEPFSSALRMSNIRNYKYDWVWDKKIPAGMSYAKYRPMQQTEQISVFTSDGQKTIYNPQLIVREVPIKSGGTKKSESAPIANKDKNFKKTYTHKQPTTLLSFDKIRRGSVHPTQKPVPLMEYLIKTYTNEGELILDFTMGSGSTGVACRNTGRNFVGIEQEEKYFKIAVERIKGLRD
jgi:DNA modification methylase